MMSMAFIQAGADSEPLRAAVFSEDIPDLDGAFAERLAGVAEGAGYSALLIGAEELSDPEQLCPETYDVVIFPNAGLLPAAASDAIESYIAAGGNLVALQAPLWQEHLLFREGAWLSRDVYEQEAASDEPVNLLFDFQESDSIDDWQRSYFPDEAEGSYEIVPEGPVEGWNALHAYMDSHRGWDSLNTPWFDESPFPEGHELTVFAAKGGAETYTLSAEWMERDGSRWIASIPLTREWRRYVLRPEDFKFWESVPERQNTTFNPANAVQFSVGLSTTHTGRVDEGQQYWVTAIGTEPLTEDNEPLVQDVGISPEDGLYPSYKYYDITESTMLHTRQDQTVLAPTTWPVAESIRAPHPRPGGGGFNKGRAWRWIPLIEARSPGNAWRGTPGVLRIQGEAGNDDNPGQGAQWAFFGVEDAAWYRHDTVMEAVGALLTRMAHGVYLLDGGTNHYTYFADQPMETGLRVVNLSKIARNDITGRVRILDRTGDSVAFETSWSLDLEPGELGTVQETWMPPEWPEDGYQVIVELLDGDKVIDRVEHGAHVWEPDEAISPITIENAEFMKDGERWRAHGVNYMPSSGIATEDWPYFEFWMGARSYDPEIIQRDLEMVRDMGLNSVAVFVYHASMEDQNLLDLLRRCEELGLYVNLSMRHEYNTPKSGWDQLGPRIVELIEYYRLTEHNIVFKYDIAWEPMWMTHTHRQEFDDQWEAWIIERYGSIENAERDWGFPVPRDDDGHVTNPDATQIREDGPWVRMVAAYRRFLDMLVYKYYSRARTLIREVDSDTYVSFRKAEAGNPTLDWQGIMPYDLPYLAAAVDILEPEAYGRIGDWERVKPGWFTYEYARWAGPDLPVIWAEAGVSTWDLGLGRSPEEKLQFQADYFTDFYRMLIGSAADGIYWWWYPGGFRTGENSDYGIVNPDKTDRPATIVIREHAQAFLDGPSAEPVDYWIEFDRDAHVSGLTGVYSEVEDEFWQAIEEGYTPGLLTAGTGTDSSNCPPLAVGNTPMDGTNPPKYLDGFFDRIEVRDHAGDWVTIEEGKAVEVTMGEPVVARMTITNLAEATWRAEGEGAVVIEARNYSTVATPIPHSVPRHETVILDDVVLAESASEAKIIEVRMLATGRTPFGPVARISIEPSE